MTLSWTPGLDVAATDGHDVYFGTDYNDVKAADTTTGGIYKGAQDSNVYPEGGSLTLDLATTYYWRIDEVNDAGVAVGGPVWRFTTEDGNARDLIPGEGYKGVDPNGVLRWTASCIGLSHDVYLGTNLNDVNNATDPDVLPGRGNQAETTYNPGGLEQLATYYWRIDEVTSGGTNKGKVHSFTTGYGGVLVHFDFDGTKGNNVPSQVTDLTGRVTFKKYIADDPEDAGTVKYGDANPFYNTSGTSVDITPEAGLYRLDPEPNTPDNPDILRLDVMAYTIELWMKADSFPGYDNNVLIKKYSPYSIEISGDDGDIVFYHTGDSTSSEEEVEAGEWYHIAAVFDLGDPEESQKLYVDGILVDTDSPSEANPSDNNDPVGIGLMARPWDDEDGYTYDDFFDGQIDELVVLDIALGPGEFMLYPGFEWANTPSPYHKQKRVDPCDPNLGLVWVPGSSVSSQHLYFGTDYEAVRDATPGSDPCGVLKRDDLSADANSYHLGATLDYSTDYYWRVDGLGAETWKGLVWKFRTRSEIVDPNLWLWYEFDEESGEKVHDSSGRDYESRDDSASDQWDPNGGQWGGALWCDDDIGLSVTNEVLSNIKNGITVSVWLKEAYRSGYDNWVFDGGRTGTHRVRAAVVAEGGEVLWRAGNDGNDTLRWDFGDIDASRLEGWHHWAFVKDEAAKTISIYFDGELADSNNQAEPTLANVQNGDFKIGAVTNHSADLIGWIDDFRLYDYAKSAKEVMELYRGGDLARAYRPQPFDGEPDVPRDLAEVSWRPGDYAVSHDVYFGTDLQAVTDANTSEHMDVYIGNQPLADTNYAMPSELELNQTYYWRIDEVNDSNVDSPWTGRVWSFRTANYIIIDDFESYDFQDNPTNETWLDGVRSLPVPPWYEYKNGATVNLGASYADPADPVHRGKQSMIFDYDNSGWGGLVECYSEAERIFDSPQDWTEAEVKILTVFFYGDPNNDANATEQMYVAVNDGDVNAVVEYGHYVDEDMNDIKEAEWQEWNVALSDFGVTLTNIKKMYIGFGDRDNPVESGFGYVYFDDVRLSPRKCVPSRLKPDYDFNRDCIVDFGEIVDLADDWLRTDVNFLDLGLAVDAPAAGPVAWWKLDENGGDTVSDAVGTNHGQIEGDYLWVTGYDGVHSALEFDGGKVVVPDAGALRPQTALSVSAWLKYSDTPSNARVIVKGGDGKETFSVEVNPDKGLTFVVRDVNNTLYDLDSEEELWRNEWIHVAGTYDANVIASYVNGELKESDTIGAKLLSQDPNGLAMGNRAESSERPFEGAVDDVRLYNYGLSASEVRYLATDGSGYVPLRSQFNLYARPGEEEVLNMKDLAMIADVWLEQKLWPPL
jgi:hypothetical protein